jgi:hypothetical protein
LAPAKRGLRAVDDLKLAGHVRDMVLDRLERDAEMGRHLRGDLHDGLGPELVGLALKLEAARNRSDAGAGVGVAATRAATAAEGKTSKGTGLEIAPTTSRRSLRLVESQLTTTGAILATYARARG